MSHFETISLPDPMNQEEVNQFEARFRQELVIYDNLLHQIVDVVGLELKTLTSKSSLAFLVEDKKTYNPDNWINDITDLKRQIFSINETKGKPGVTWLLSDAIYEAYVKLLDQEIAKADDEKLKRKLNLIKQSAEQSWDFNKKAQENEKPVAFGGVSTDYIPKWYYLYKKP